MTSATLDPAALRDHVARSWRDSILPAISDFIRIPAKSPAFDADWAANGFLDDAVELAAAWCRERKLAGMTVEIIRR